MTAPLVMSDGLYVSPIRPNRDRIRWFVKSYPYLIGALISAVLFVVAYPSDKILTLLAITVYWIYLGAKLVFRRSNNWGIYYRSAWLQFMRAFVLVISVTVFLHLLYTQTEFFSDISNANTLWLLYLLPLCIMSQRGSTVLLIITLVVTGASLLWVEPISGQIWLTAPGLGSITNTYVAKMLWLTLISLILYVFLRYMGDTIADLNLILEIQKKLRTVEDGFLKNPSEFDEQAFLEESVKRVIAEFGYDHVNVFKLVDSHHLECAAAGSEEGKKLGESRFLLQTSGRSSIIGHVATSGISYISNDVSRDNNYLPHEAFPHTRSELAVPIRIRNRLFGVLDVQANRSDFFLTQDRQAIEILANHIGWVIDSTEHLEHLAFTDNVIQRILGSFFNQSELHDILQEITDLAKQELKADLVVLYCFDNDEDFSVTGPIYSGRTAHPEIFGKSRLTNDSIVYRLRNEEQVIFIHEDLAELELSDYLLFQPSSFHRSTAKPTFIEREGIRSNVIIRLLEDEVCVGVLFLNYRSPKAFTEWEKRRFVAFSNLAALAIQRLQLDTQALQNEMAELAAGVHDMLIGDTLGLYKLLDAVPDSISEANWQKHRFYVEQAKEMTEKLHNDIRHIAGLLKEDTHDNLVGDVERLKMIYSSAFGIEINSSWIGELHYVNPAVIFALRAILREAIANAVHRGLAHNITVSTTVTEESLCFCVEDDGAGFEKRNVKDDGGMQNMHARTYRLGGSLTVDTIPGQGTKLTASFPL